MGKSIQMPGVQPTLLSWARESAHLSLDDVAAAFKKPVYEIEAWESGAKSPSYAQLEKLAYSLYKRPLAIFFLPTPPIEPKPEVEFRALPDADLRRLRRETVLLIRRARAQQASLVELFGDRVIREHDPDPVHSTDRYRATAKKKYDTFSHELPDVEWPTVIPVTATAG